MNEYFLQLIISFIALANTYFVWSILGIILAVWLVVVGIRHLKKETPIGYKIKLEYVDIPDAKPLYISSRLPTQVTEDEKNAMVFVYSGHFDEIKEEIAMQGMKVTKIWVYQE